MLPVAFLQPQVPYNPVGSLEIPMVMLLVFGTAKLLAELFERLHQPGIVGEILAGVVVGPSVLGLVQPTRFLTSLAELGVMFLLFRVGLEVKASELFKVGPVATLTAFLGVVFPMVMGWGLMLMWGQNNIQSAFAGTAMVATSIGITAQVLASKGLLSLQASRIILAAAVIDDVLGLLVLAIVSSFARGGVNVLQLGLTAVLAIGFTLVIAKWGTGLVSRVLPRVEMRLRVEESQFALALVLLFGLAYLATFAGVAAIIGAFLAGMALAESVSHRVHDLAQGVTELLVPFFLAGIGLHLHLDVLANPAVLLLTALYILAACLSKLIGCGLGALGVGLRDAVRVGVGMIPRGEVGMVVAQLGLTLGVVTQTVYGVVVVMSVVTTLIAPPLLSVAFRNAVAPVAEEEFRLG